MPRPRPFCSSLTLLFVACLTTTAYAGAPEADRQAILAMAGEYKIDFRFEETVAIAEGYEVREPYHAEATEFVEVIEDAGDFISLQHVLVLHNDTGEARVVKHWRQDWSYEDREMLVYEGRNTWAQRTVPAEVVQGAWTQSVHQVDDSPRYEGLGRWTHEAGRSAWESQETWRPLPRRERTKRSDYHVLVARNRHVVTPAGWVHEQDNRKVVLDDQGRPVKVLAHEIGVNSYDRVDDVDFSAGREYWDATQAYWSDVRDRWAQISTERERVELRGKVEDQRLYQAMFALAAEVADAGQYDADAVRPQIDAELARFLVD
ncbi:MAG: DUF6607 family protein [Planctomycetota bacterium]